MGPYSVFYSVACSARDVDVQLDMDRIGRCRPWWQVFGFPFFAIFTSRFVIRLHAFFMLVSSGFHFL